jgi:TolA-binding protein
MKPVSSTAPRKSRRRIVLSVILLLLCSSACAAWYYRPNPHLAAVKQLQKELFSPAGRQLSQDDRRQKFEKLREEVNMLTAAQRLGLRADGMRRRTDQLNRFFKLSKDEKARYLDNLIDREEQRRQARQDGGGGPPNPRAANSAGTPQERDKRREDALDSLSATQRAEWTEFRQEMNARRQELGLPVNNRR